MNSTKRMQAPDRPLLRYPGSKYRIAQWIISHFPKHKIYVEPFGGSGAVLFQKPVSKVEVYNDLDKEIVNVFRVLRDESKAEQLIKQIFLTPYSRTEHEGLFEVTGQPVEDARRFVVRSIMNIAKGPYAKSGFDTRINDDFYISRLNFFKDYPGLLQQFIRRLKNVVVECRDFRDIINQFDRPETLFYCDPEYINTDAIYSPDFNKSDHVDLITMLREVRGMVVISGYDTHLYRDTLEGGVG